MHRLRFLSVATIAERLNAGQAFAACEFERLSRRPHPLGQPAVTAVTAESNADPSTGLRK